VKSKATTFKEFRYWLCDIICPDCIWNENISLENDRLTILVEEAKANSYLEGESE